VEEFMFRVIMQGSLERLADGPSSASTVDAAPLETSIAAAATSEIARAYRPPTTIAEDVLLHRGDANQAAWKPTHVWPIVVSSLVFSSLHLGQGAAPIPLFALSLCLGYLYRQTGKITAPLVVHMILNTVTLSVEFTRFLAEGG
jgi:membrane protease YdiL (CAAX protease family)